MKKFIILLGIVTILSSCKDQQNDNVVTEEIMSITVANSVEKEFAPVIKYSGTAFATKEANLGTAVPGRVEKIHFNIGDHVNKGDLIVELSSELYTQTQIERNTLKKDFERVTRLKDKGSLSEQDYDHVKAKYEASVAKTEMMKKNAEIRAPFSGTIVDHIVQEGENYLFAPSLKAGYSMTSGIVKLMQLDVLNVEIDVNEKEISKIKNGQKANVIFDAYPENIYPGKVVSIDPILSTISRTAKVNIQIQNPDLFIKPGMFAQLEIALPKQKSVFVPIESLYRQPGTGNDFVFKIENNIAIKTPVQRIYTKENLVAVTGIKKDCVIAAAGKSKLNDQQKVKIEE